MSTESGDSVSFQKESPDVETPGLLVKALISSYFIMTDVRRLYCFKSISRQIYFSISILRYLKVGIFSFFIVSGNGD